MPNMTKGQALQRLLEEWHMATSDLMAFGDANNDKDMLELAEHSYVMANSHDKSLFEVARQLLQVMMSKGYYKIIEQEVS